MRKIETGIQLSASDLVGHLNCRHLTALDIGVCKGTISKPHIWDPLLELLRERGRRHEEAFIQHLEDQGLTSRHIDGVDITPAAVAATREAMNTGVDIIIQAAMQNDRWAGTLLPADGRFEVELEDGTLISNDINLDALRHKIAVFNTDFVEDNFQWKAGSAKPVFYIGKDQAETGKALQEAELKREPLQIKKNAAADAKGKADRAFASFKTNTGRTIGEQIADRNFNARNLDSEFAKGDRDATALLDEQSRLKLFT